MRQLEAEIIKLIIIIIIIIIIIKEIKNDIEILTERQEINYSNWNTNCPSVKIQFWCN